MDNCIHIERQLGSSFVDWIATGLARKAWLYAGEMTEVMT